MKKVLVALALFLACASSAAAETIGVFHGRAVRSTYELPAGICLGEPLSAGASICANAAGTGYNVSGSLGVSNVLTANKLSVKEMWFGESYARDGSFVISGTLMLFDQNALTVHYTPRVYSEFASGEGRIDADVEDLETDSNGTKVVVLNAPFLQAANTDAAQNGGYVVYVTTYAGSQDYVAWDKAASTATQVVFRTVNGKPAKFGFHISAIHRGCEANRSLRRVGPAGR